jgi:ABC-type transport system involved in multi-copper enzyme maturation permease subunit
LRGLVVSEVRKTLSTKAWWALLIPAALFSVVEGYFDFPASSVYISVSFTTLFAVLFGVVCASGEYRHRTIATSYLVARRPQLTVAKMVLAALVGAGYALVATAMAIAGQLISGFPLGDELPSMLTAGAGATLVLALWAMLGVGLGTLIKNRLLAVLATLLYLIVEPTVVWLVGLTGRDSLTMYLPGQASDAALGGLTGGAQFGGGFGVAQPWWLMLLVFAGWAAVVGLAGTVAAQRRDIA